MKSKNKKNLIFISLLLFFLLGAGFVFAQEITYPRVPGAIPPQDFLNDPAVPSENILSLYVKYFFNLALWLAGTIALGALIYGGLRYLFSTGKAEAMASAKNQITSAFFGLLILLSSYLILNILSPEFTILKISTPEPITVIERPSVAPPPTKEFRSAINTEIPFGIIIEEGIFEGTIPWEEDKRIPRINNNAVITKQLADNLKTQSENLKSASDACDCGRAEPCCEISSPGCILGTSCFSKPGCTCDPCRGDPRARIQDLVGGSSLSSILNPGELLQYDNIMGNISSILGAGNTAPALELSTNLANSVGNIGDFSNVLGFGTNISNIIDIPGDLARVFEIAGDLTNIIQNPSDLFASIRDLSSLIGMPENLTQLFDFAEIGLSIIENPNDLNAIFGAIEGISEQAGLNLNEVFQAVGPIGNIVMNSQDLNTVFGEIQGIAGATGINLNEVFQATNPLKDVAKNPEDLARVLGQIEEISTKISVSDLNEIFKIVGEASKIAQNPQELIEIIEPQISSIIESEFLDPILKNIENIVNLTIDIPELINVQTTIEELAEIGLSSQQLITVLDGLEGISGVIKNPTDLGNIQIAIQDLFGIGLIPREITDILGNLGDISGVIKNPTDLGNIQIAIQDLLNIIPLPENLTNILRELQGISGIIQNLTNLSNIQSALGQLVGIIPGLGNFTNILGNLEDISNIIQDPTNLSNVMGSLAGLAQIAPLGQFSDVLGEINDLGNLFQSPQNMTNTFAGKGKNQIEIDKLTAEQIKTEEEVRLLKEQLDRLERAEKFMLDCYNWIDSLSDFLIKKTDFAEKKWPFRKINFWEEILIKGDWATFYCPVSGTITGEAEYIVSDISPETMKELEEAAVTEIPEPTEPTACTTEAPVGEIIDRAKRTGYKLVERMETLIELDKKLIDAVDKLQVLVSQCTSQRCFSECICISCGKGGGCCPCIKECVGNPCPSGQIANQLDEIRRIWQEIVYVIEGKEGNDTPENIGIIPIIDKITPKILEDLEIIIRERMKTCVSEIPSDISGSEEAFKNLMLLSNCESAVGGVGPEGVIIQNCCLRQGEFQKEFDECLGLCYLQKGDKKYKDCLQKCLEKKADELEMGGFKETAEILRTCRHKLNFYCCGG